MFLKRIKSVDVYTLSAGLLYTILGTMIVAALAVAFTHSEALSSHVLPQQDGWKNWVNAVLSELLPMAGFLSLFQRWRTKRNVAVALGIIGFSLFVSGMSQLYAAGHVLPYTTEFLAVWPVIGALLVGHLGWSEVTYSVERRQALAELAEQAAESAGLAALERERQAREDVKAAARAAELRARTIEDREAKAAQREWDREQAALAQTRKHELAVAAQTAQADAVRAAAEVAARREGAAAQMAEQAALLERQRYEAAERRKDAESAAQREVLAAQARREARPAPPAGAGNGGRHHVAGGTSGAVRPRAADRAAAVQGILDGLGDVPRVEAVRAVAQGLGIAARTARNFVPDRWPAARTAVVPDRSQPDLRAVQN